MIYKTNLIVLFFLWFAGTLFATKSDTLVYIDELSFDINEESQNFVFIDNSHLINLLYYTDNHLIDEQKFSIFKSQFAGTSLELKTAIAKTKKHEKQIKLIYKAIHERFLSKYESFANFHQIITDGVYNCVTATALYALMLDELQIPYNIKETPSHVYLIAFPLQEQILMESTNPTQGYVFHNNEYKNMFVQNLNKSKLISDQEYNSTNVNELFNKYYYADKNINLQQLISIHYSNNATSYFEKKNFRAFHKQIKKASYLYPCPRNTFLLFSSILLLLENVDYSEPQQIEDLLFLSRFVDKGISAQDLLNEFKRISYEYLVNSSRPKELDEIYVKFDEAITAEKLNSEMAFVYNYDKGRYFLIKGQYIKSYPFVKSAFQLNPGNSDAQINLINNLGNLVSIEKSSIKTLAEMDSLSSDFEVLLENNNFIRIYGMCNLKCIEEYFKNKNPNDGDLAILSFEKIIEQYPIVKFPENIIGRAYSEAAVFYFKKGQNKKCMEYLNRGREIAPNSRELKSRLMMLR